MITAIFTNNEKATLTIETSEQSEPLTLVQMGSNKSILLKPGTNKLTVGVGVFKVLSEGPIQVTSDMGHVYVASHTNSKDQGFPDPPKAWVSSFDQDFFTNARGGSPPR